MQGGGPTACRGRWRKPSANEATNARTLAVPSQRFHGTGLRPVRASRRLALRQYPGTRRSSRWPWKWEGRALSRSQAREARRLRRKSVSMRDSKREWWCARSLSVFGKETRPILAGYFFFPNKCRNKSTSAWGRITPDTPSAASNAINAS